MQKDEWKNDSEYREIVSDLMATDMVKKLANYTQHHHSTRPEHSIAVSLTVIRLPKEGA